MLRNALFSLLILIVGNCYAQDNYFALIQADNNQPFYVRLGDKTLSSTIKGRLILSQLKGGSCRVIIGFPKEIFPEQQYTFNIGEKDLEFQLKDLGEKGWGLFNPQTLELKMPDEKKEDVSKNRLEGVKKDDAFSRLMAGVVSDTAVMYNTYAMEATLRDSPAVSKVVMADTTSSAPQGTASGASSVAGAPISDSSPTTSGIPASRTPTTAGGRRGNEASRLRVVGSFFVVQNAPQKERNGRHRERAKALPRGRRRAAHRARMVARDERRHGRPEILRPARDLAARVAADRRLRRLGGHELLLGRAQTVGERGCQLEGICNRICRHGIAPVVAGHI